MWFSLSIIVLFVPLGFYSSAAQEDESPFLKSAAASDQRLRIFSWLQVYKATWRVQTVAVKMLTHTTEKQMDAFMR